MTGITDIDHRISPQEVLAFLNSGEKLQLDPKALDRIRACRNDLERLSSEKGKAIYGVNTGFGSLCNTAVSDEDLGALQRNLLLSHACGQGEEVSEEIVRLMLLLKIRGLSYGHSGVRTETVELLAEMYNRGISPVVYQQGSLGASGDLAPLAHLCLPLMAEGEVRYNGKKMHASEALRAEGLQPVQLRSKEGLALINGTQFMSAFACWSYVQSRTLADTLNLIAAMSLDAFDCRLDPFYTGIHEIRPHKGQIAVAARIRELLEGSEIAKEEKTHVQDPYSFRCIPQVHGASMDALDYIGQVITTEINSVTDNPLVFGDQDLVVSGGNFHGQPLALVLDYLAIAMAELGSISERRTYKLISGQRELPPYLAVNPGLHSGFMIPQYTAASIVSQNKQLCTPASVDSIDSSNGQEDHVSMGANGATKAYRVVQNVKTIAAIELLNAAQALEFRRPKKSSPAVEKLHQEVRKQVSFNDADRLLADDISRIRSMI